MGSPAELCATFPSPFAVLDEIYLRDIVGHEVLGLKHAQS